MSGAINKYSSPSFVEDERDYTNIYWVYKRSGPWSQMRVGELSQRESRLLFATEPTLAPRVYLSFFTRGPNATTQSTAPAPQETAAVIALGRESCGSFQARTANAAKAAKTPIRINQIQPCVRWGRTNSSWAGCDSTSGTPGSRRSDATGDRDGRGRSNVPTNRLPAVLCRSNIVFVSSGNCCFLTNSDSSLDRWAATSMERRIPLAAGSCKRSGSLFPCSSALGLPEQPSNPRAPDRREARQR